MFCPKCGAQIADGAKFCPKCGNQMAVGQAAPGGPAPMPGPAPRPSAMPGKPIPGQPAPFNGAPAMPMARPAASTDMYRYLAVVLAVVALLIGLLIPCIRTTQNAMTASQWTAGLASLSNQISGNSYDTGIIRLQESYSPFSVGYGIPVAMALMGQSVNSTDVTGVGILFNAIALILIAITAVGALLVLARKVRGLLVAGCLLSLGWEIVVMAIIVFMGDAFTLEPLLPVLACLLYIASVVFTVKIGGKGGPVRA